MTDLKTLLDPALGYIGLGMHRRVAFVPFSIDRANCRGQHCPS